MKGQGVQNTEGDTDQPVQAAARRQPAVSQPFCRWALGDSLVEHPGPGKTFRDKDCGNDTCLIYTAALLSPPTFLQ
jgi:hypothetical protein